MAYTNHFDGEALNNHYTNDKYRGLSGEPVSLGPWNMDRGRSYSDTQSSPAADHHTRTSATSTASLRSNNQTHRPKLKHITCHYWATEEGCKKTDEDCYYAHKETTFGVAQKPVQVEPGSECSLPDFLFLTSFMVVVWGLGLTISCDRTRSRRQKRVEPSPCLHQLATGAFAISYSKPRARSPATGQSHRSQSDSELPSHGV